MFGWNERFHKFTYVCVYYGSWIRVASVFKVRTLLPHNFRQNSTADDDVVVQSIVHTTSGLFSAP